MSVPKKPKLTTSSSLLSSASSSFRMTGDDDRIRNNDNRKFGIGSTNIHGDCPTNEHVIGLTNKCNSNTTNLKGIILALVHRARRVIARYQKREGGLIPVRFTGSWDDLLRITSHHQHSRLTSTLESLPQPLITYTSETNFPNVARDNCGTMRITTVPEKPAGEELDSNVCSGDNDNDDALMLQRGEELSLSSPILLETEMSSLSRRTMIDAENRGDTVTSTSNNGDDSTIGVNAATDGIKNHEISVPFRTTDLRFFNDEQLNEWCKLFQEYWLTLLKWLRITCQIGVHGGKMTSGGGTTTVTNGERGRREEEDEDVAAQTTASTVIFSGKNKNPKNELPSSSLSQSVSDVDILLLPVVVDTLLRIFEMDCVERMTFIDHSTRRNKMSNKESSICQSCTIEINRTKNNGDNADEQVIARQVAKRLTFENRYLSQRLVERLDMACNI